MEHFIGENRPIFVQIAERIEENVLAGRLAEEEQVPSTNQFAALYQVNPATAAMEVNLLVDQGILYKKQGVGMFVATGSRERLLAERRELFFERYVVAMLCEARRLGLEAEQIIEMVQRGESAMSTIVEAECLLKQCGNLTAIDHVCFSLEADKIYGLLGRNGSGKPPCCVC